MDPSELDLDDQAKETVYDFLKSEGEMRSKEQIFSLLDGPTIEVHPNLGELHIYKGPLGEFWVCKESLKLFTYSSPERFTTDEAQEYAKNFLSRHIENFALRNFKPIKAEKDDPFWEEEWIEEPKHSEEISIFKNWIVLSVNLDTRRVHYFNSSNLRLVRTTPTNLNENAARQIIHEKFPEGEIDDLELMEHTTNGGKTSFTIWSATVRPDDDPETPLTIISINADTGDIID